MNVTGPLEVVAQRMDIKKTQMIVQGDRRWGMTVAVAHDYHDGRAIGFRNWVSPADVCKTQDAAIKAAVESNEQLAAATE